ncbi:MAG: hypothetical protein WC780_05845 [Lentimicrobiaceae bacterium]
MSHNLSLATDRQINNQIQNLLSLTGLYVFLAPDLPGNNVPFLVMN